MIESVLVKERACMFGSGREVILEDDSVLADVCIRVNTERDEACGD